MEKELISAILQQPAVKATFNKYVHKYSFLYSDLAADLQKALIEAIYRYETDSEIWDKITVQDILETERPEFSKFKWGLVSYLTKICRFKSSKIANRYNHRTCLDTELHEEIKQNARKTSKTCNLYQHYFNQNFHLLTATQQEFCESFLQGERFASFRKTRMLQRIRERLGVKQMGDLNKQYAVRQALLKLEDVLYNIEDVSIESLFDTSFGNYSLYEHMQLELRKELILALRNSEEISNAALNDFTGGLYAWRDKALLYLQGKCELELEDIT